MKTAILKEELAYFACGGRFRRRAELLAVQMVVARTGLSAAEARAALAAAYHDVLDREREEAERNKYKFEPWRDPRNRER